MNPPTDATPIFLACTRCGDQPHEHCPECQGRGTRAHAITRCPCASVPSDAVNATDYFRFAERGNLPAPGAVLEQCRSFMDAWEFWRGEKAMCGVSE